MQKKVWSFVSEKDHGFYSEPIRKMSAEILFESTKTPHIAAKQALRAFDEMLAKENRRIEILPLKKEKKRKEKYE